MLSAISYSQVEPGNAVLEALPPVGMEAEPLILYSLPETRNKLSPTSYYVKSKIHYPKNLANEDFQIFAYPIPVLFVR